MEQPPLKKWVIAGEIGRTLAQPRRVAETRCPTQETTRPRRFFPRPSGLRAAEPHDSARRCAPGAPRLLIRDKPGYLSSTVAPGDSHRSCGSSRAASAAAK